MSVIDMTANFAEIAPLGDVFSRIFQVMCACESSGYADCPTSERMRPQRGKAREARLITRHVNCADLQERAA